MSAAWVFSAIFRRFLTAANTLAGVVKRLDGIAVGAEAALHLALPLEVLTRCHGANGLGGQPGGVIAA